ncbi:hypothetical protein PHYSODRAFT_339754 [Phytophthora sojae]|uniref:Uncharacterized protein n=1 Tax=Phytophthora sojae (strain P6497) TaxID=1094619 RepID=G5A7H0_PHYSP|nr:hypothetical protein PHYSODRAFT_339754 [Phytophthora sojae]EGZ07849.1 hypothetical protein PHYSODRAFT_339754 [Phytophthora sojae]|eukprot:XP_009536021.1 hypothetical protein PHYSODRAFT_339754 [Phytophthora sojae]
MERQDQPQRLPHEDVDKLIYSTTSRRVAAPVKLCLLRYDRKPRKTAHAKERSNLISLFARAELSGIRHRESNPMDAILSRVGVSDAQLRQHCEAAVLDELQQADARVQDVVAALQQALKVVRASRELHQSLVLNECEQVQASFRRLGASCNQIGPLLRLLHRDMGATVSSASDQSAAVAQAGASEAPGASAAVSTVSTAPQRTETKPAAPQSSASSSTASEYELSSDEDEDDDEPEVVEVAPPTSSKKRKAATLDLSQSPPPAARRKTTTTTTLDEDTQTVRSYLASQLKQLQALPAHGYSVATHKELAAYVKKVFAAADKFDDWQPRDDPTLARLLHEMERRVGVFKDSVAQLMRCKTISKWQKEMTGSAFVPSLDLVAVPIHRIVSKAHVDASDKQERKKKYFLPLLDTMTKFFASAAVTKSASVLSGGVKQCNAGLGLLAALASRDGTGLSCRECMRVEELLYLLRLVMHKVPQFRGKAAKLVSAIVNLFPEAARPNFGCSVDEPTQSEPKKKKSQSNHEKDNHGKSEKTSKKSKKKKKKH